MKDYWRRSRGAVFSFLIALAMMAGPRALPGQTTRPSAATRPAARLRVEAADEPAVKVGIGGTPDRGFMSKHATYLAKAKAGNIDLYMEGDSITDFWEGTHKADWVRNFGGWRAGDFGISGDRTQHVLWRLENGELDGVNPKAIVLLIGTNNLPSNTVYLANSVEDTFKGYQAIVAKLREKAPAAHILLMGVFPREDNKYTPEQIKSINEEIQSLNAMIATLADGSQIKYLNINDKMTDGEGKLLPGVMAARDHLHPNDMGYDIWAGSMKPILTEWLGPPAETK